MHLDKIYDLLDKQVTRWTQKFMEMLEVENKKHEVKLSKKQQWCADKREKIKKKSTP